MLPFLKNRRARSQTGPQEERLVQGSASDHLEDHCAQEMLDAIASKDVKRFRAAFEALILNCFDYEDHDEPN